MSYLLRFFVGIFGAVLGTLAVIISLLFFGDGFHFPPSPEFAVSLFIGAIVGFVVGAVFYKAAGRAIAFLARFGVETNS